MGGIKIACPAVYVSLGSLKLHQFWPTRSSVSAPVLSDGACTNASGQIRAKPVALHARCRTRALRTGVLCGGPTGGVPAAAVPDAPGRGT